MSPIGYYVHHHGEGHRRRAVAIAGAAPERFTLIGAGVSNLAGPFETIELADDRLGGDDAFSGRDGAEDRPDALHYAPYGHDGVRSRIRTIASWIAERRPSLLVVDVSVEMAMLARLCATPTIVVRLAGDRNDPAHLDAFRGARAVLAPFDRRLDGDDVPGWVRRKTIYAPGVCDEAPHGTVRDNVVVTVFGRGGTKTTVSKLSAAAASTPSHDWRVLGDIAPALAPALAPDNLHVLGWVGDVAREIGEAGIVVGGAGDGVLGAVAAAARPFVCIPEDRPFGEQVAKARRLEALGAAVVRPTWPDASEWPEVLDRARSLDASRIGSLHLEDGAAAAAAAILEAAQ